MFIRHEQDAHVHGGGDGGRARERERMEGRRRRGEERKTTNTNKDRIESLVESRQQREQYLEYQPKPRPHAVTRAGFGR